jgi:SAM-dependent methyltransferase
VLAPLPRSTQPELLDAPGYAPRALADNLRDLSRTSAVLGIGGVVWAALVPFLEPAPARPATLLDVASGGADLPRYLARRARRAGRDLEVLASDRRREIIDIVAAGREPPPYLQCDARALPLPDGGVDIVTCTLALHHFDPPDAIVLLRELRRAARLAVLILDLRRCWPAYLGARALALGPWHAMARHDGPLSVRRAYTPAEIGALLARAGLAGRVETRRPFLTLTTVCGKLEI